MLNNQHSILSKFHCQIMTVIGLCLTMIFVCSSTYTFADDGDYYLYPIKEDNTLSYNSDNHLDIGFATAEMGHSQIHVGSLENYYEHVNRLVSSAIYNVQSYFTKEVRITDTSTYFLNFFKSYGYQYFLNRDYFLNVYVRLYDYGSYLQGDLVYQICNGFDGISTADVIVRHNTAVNYTLHDDITLYGAEISGNIVIEGLWLPKARNLLFSTSDSTSNLYRGTSKIVSSFDYYINNYFNTTNYFLTFYRVNGDDIQFYCNDFLTGLYILPLYLDSPVYFPLSFMSTVNGIDIHGDFSIDNSQPLYFYTPGTVLANSDDFSVEHWSSGEFNSGIVYGSYFNNPYLTPTPIPTFSPLTSPTPVPTYLVNVTITPIVLPINPNISNSYGDPISYIMAMINMVGDVLSSNVVTFFSTVVQYIYNSSYFFQILMFVIPAIILIAFVVGRLKKK